MVVISKEVVDRILLENPGCEVYHYWTSSCIKAFLFVIPKIAKGTATFFMPIFLVRLALDYKMKKKNLSQRFIKRLIRTLMYGVTMGSLMVSSICCQTKIVPLNFYSMITVPGAVSGLAMLIESEENQILNSMIFFNSFVETCLNTLKLSSVQQTALFMMVSGVLMHLFERRKKEINFNYLWFYTPKFNKQEENDEDSKQSLKQIGEFSLNGFLKYSLAGFGINVTKRLLGMFNRLLKDPKKIYKVLFHKSNVYFGLFIGGYVGLYRAINSYLNSHKRAKWHGFVSGTVSGIAYMFCPTIQVIVLAITTILQILYHQICDKYKITNHFYQRLLLFQATHAINLHNKFFNDDYCSPYYAKMIDACTDNLTVLIKTNFITKYLT